MEKDIKRSTSKKKQELIDEKLNSPLEVGEVVTVNAKKVGGYIPSGTRNDTCTIYSIEDGITVYVGRERDYREGKTKLHKIKESDIVSRDVFNIGGNPFSNDRDRVRPVAFSLESIVYTLDVFRERADKQKEYKIGGTVVKDCNWNPFIYLKDGSKKYYQRPFVWSVKDKQLLIESIYNNIDCGKIIVRKRGWTELEAMQKKGETELAFNDIVDGKQRLGAIRSFVLCEFKDLQGNYYSDLSYLAQNEFFNHQLFSYAELPEYSKDEDVLNQFLKLNFTGVPQSEEHINFVKELSKQF